MHRADEISANVSDKRSYGAQHTGVQWNNDPPDSDLACSQEAVHRPGTAEWKQSELFIVHTLSGEQGHENRKNMRRGDSDDTFGYFLNFTIRDLCKSCDG